MKTKLNQSKLKLAIVSAFALGSASLSTAGYAATTFDNMVILTDVAMSCTVDAAQLNFSTYDPTSGTPNDASAVITSSCTHGGSAKITLNQGASPAAGSTDSVPLRQMHNATDSTTLAYSLYQNSDRNIVWGNTAGTGLGFTATGGDDTSTVYGRIANGLVANVGAYADSVSVTLTY